MNHSVASRSRNIREKFMIAAHKAEMDEAIASIAEA
jgi:hypothetical protein